MATEVADEKSAASADSQGSGGGKSNKIKVILLLAVVMAGEAGVMYFLVPAPANMTSQGDEATSQFDDELAEANTATIEVQIDRFNVTNSRAAGDGIVHVTFELFCVVAADNKHTFSQAANTDHKARVRQSIVKVARSSSLEDLNDPNLTTIKRLIQEEINKVLSKSYVIEVVISDFTTMEQ